VASDRPVDRNVGDLQMVAEFEQQVVGVAVSASGRVFVSFPANGIDTVKKSVAESHQRQGGRLPERGDQYLEHRRASTHFLSAQSVTWIPATRCGAGRGQPRLGHGAHLRRGQTRGHRPDDQRGQADHRVPDSLITKGTSINDVRFDLARGAAGFAYIPDSSAARAAAYRVDLSTGNACGGWRTIHVLPDPASARPWRAAVL